MVWHFVACEQLPARRNAQRCCFKADAIGMVAGADYRVSRKAAVRHRTRSSLPPPGTWNESPIFLLMTLVEVVAKSRFVALGRPVGSQPGGHCCGCGAEARRSDDLGVGRKRRRHRSAVLGKAHGYQRASLLERHGQFVAAGGRVFPGAAEDDEHDVSVPHRELHGVAPCGAR